LDLLLRASEREKIDAGGASSNNVATILNQARMAIEHPIFDPDTNKQVLLDHLYLISAGEITRPARQWLVGHLDSGHRRHIIFMDRDEFLDHSARILLDLRLEEQRTTFEGLFDDAVPF
jgi:hypothetical protein